MFNRIREAYRIIKGDINKLVGKKEPPPPVALPSRAWKGWKTRSKKRVITSKE